MGPWSEEMGPRNKENGSSEWRNGPSEWGKWKLTGSRYESTWRSLRPGLTTAQFSSSNNISRNMERAYESTWRSLRFGLEQQQCSGSSSSSSELVYSLFPDPFPASPKVVRPHLADVQGSTHGCPSPPHKRFLWIVESAPIDWLLVCSSVPILQSYKYS